MFIVVCSINKLDHVRGDLIWFYAVGIGKKNTRDPQYGWPLKTFSTLVSECGDNDVSASDALFDMLLLDACKSNHKVSLKRDDQYNHKLRLSHFVPSFFNQHIFCCYLTFRTVPKINLGNLCGSKFYILNCFVKTYSIVQ